MNRTQTIARYRNEAQERRDRAALARRNGCPNDAAIYDREAESADAKADWHAAQLAAEEANATPYEVRFQYDGEPVSAIRGKFMPPVVLCPSLAQACALVADGLPTQRPQTAVSILYRRSDGSAAGVMEWTTTESECHRPTS